MTNRLMGIEGDVVSCLYEIVFDDNSLNKHKHKRREEWKREGKDEC